MQAPQPDLQLMFLGQSKQVLARASALFQHSVNVPNHHGDARLDSWVLDQLCQPLQHQVNLARAQVPNVPQDGFHQLLYLLVGNHWQGFGNHTRVEVEHVGRANQRGREEVHAFILLAVLVPHPPVEERLPLHLPVVPLAEGLVHPLHIRIPVTHDFKPAVALPEHDLTPNHARPLLELHLHCDILLILLLVNQGLEHRLILVLQPPVEGAKAHGFLGRAGGKGLVDVVGFAFPILGRPAGELIKQLPPQPFVVNRQPNLNPVRVVLAVVQVDCPQENPDVLGGLADVHLQFVHTRILPLHRVLDDLLLLGGQRGAEQGMNVIHHRLRALGNPVRRRGQVLELVELRPAIHHVVRRLDVEQGVLVADV